MLQKMGGYKVGKGVGKHETGTTEPLLADSDIGRVKQGIGETIPGQNKDKFKGKINKKDLYDTNEDEMLDELQSKLKR